MERIYKLIINKEDLTKAEDKLENEEINHSDFSDLEGDPLEIAGNPMFNFSDNILLVVVNEENLGKIISFMLMGGVKTTNVQDITKDIFYNKIDFTKAEEKFLKAVEKCLLYSFVMNDVLDKINEIGSVECLTETDKMIIRNR